MSTSPLTPQEEILFNTIRNEIMMDLGAKVDVVLRESIIRLRGVTSEDQRTEIKNKAISEIKQTTQRILEF